MIKFYKITSNIYRLGLGLLAPLILLAIFVDGAEGLSLMKDFLLLTFIVMTLFLWAIYRKTENTNSLRRKILRYINCLSLGQCVL